MSEVISQDTFSNLKPERLRHPMKKVNDGWWHISWLEALNLVSQKINESARSTVPMSWGS